MDSGALGRLLSLKKPAHLFHYTGPAGAIGVLTTQTLWAGRPADMNDATEQLLAHEYAARYLQTRGYPLGSFGEGMIQYAIELLSSPGRVAFDMSRAYTVSLTPDHDSLEQWRAYCPRSGGVALGFSSLHLERVAAAQGFTLSPCVYDEPSQIAIVKQIVVHHLEIWDSRMPLNAKRQGISSHLVRDLVSDLERYAPLLKHQSFAAEREWRLISPLVSGTSPIRWAHAPGATGIKQFQVFSLLTPDHPTIPNQVDELDEHDVWPHERQGFRVVIGPNVDPRGMEESVRTLVPLEFGRLLHIERTRSPYR